ncbi:pirin family protein [Celerinatantimonas sp. YJH-8]|uniref:pirin family protein n=1 Tax=Celerinatantimonas sp. YJH-8 TaxID=3228714 RepID=UPI0038CB023E
MLIIRHADARGQADLGWLRSQHSFSFAQYYDPRHMGVSALRVINEDHVKPGCGFETHSHQNMEIISYVLAGTLAHQDSYGHKRTLSAGEFQLMSAGSGIYHSEFNPSPNQPLDFLQIWVKPAVQGGKASYQQRFFESTNGLTAIVTPDGRESTLTIKQDTSLYRLQLTQGQNYTLPIHAGRILYMHIVQGNLQIADQLIQDGDGITIKDESSVPCLAQSNMEALLFDLPA